MSIRCMADQAWELETAELLGFLAEPRSWQDLDAWAAERHFNLDWPRHAVAWLEDQHKIQCFYLGGPTPSARAESGRTRWVANGYMLERSRAFCRGEDPEVPKGLMLGPATLTPPSDETPFESAAASVEIARWSAGCPHETQTALSS